MFQLEDIKAAHSKVKSGADFPNYIQDLKRLGVIKYDTYVHDGHAIYYGADSYQVHSPSKYSLLNVQSESDPGKFRNYLKIHQEGKTDYPTFCNHSAESGVEKWTVDLEQMTCTYYDTKQQSILEEKIPTV